MSARSKLLVAVLLLVLLGGGVAIYKSLCLGVPFWQGTRVYDWQIEAKVSFFANGKPIHARLTLPQIADKERLGQAGSLNYRYHLEEHAGRSTADWSSRPRDGAQSLYFWVTVPLDDAGGVEPVAAAVPELDEERLIGTAGVAAEAVVQRLTEAGNDPDPMFVDLFSRLLEKQPSQELSLLKRQYGREYREHGSIMLGIELLRMAGVPARMAYGVRLQEDLGVQSPMPLVEYHDGVYWKIRDPLQPNRIPERGSLYVWHRGGGAMLEVTGGENSDVVFTVARERVPQASLTDLQDSPFWVSTILGLPLSERAVFRYLVLIPLGSFVVVLLRNVVGVPTLGTFMPVLIALALLEMPLVRGLVMFSSLTAVGLWFRFLLSRLNLLVVPRVAACVVIVTMLMMLMSVVSYRLGFSGVVDITLFPMIILAWTIERMSILWEEEGKRSALTQVGGSLVVAVCAFLCMKVGQIQYWAYNFPELLLVLLAGILLIGRYTGYRLSELSRFRNFESA